MKAILQVADTGPLESLVYMLREAGIEPWQAGPLVRDSMIRAGCDTVLDPRALVEGMGYEQAGPLPEATPDDIGPWDIFFDVKAHRNGAAIERLWPQLSGRIFWYRINGGKPEISTRGGDEVNLSGPILTPNLWYTADPREIGVEADAKHHGPNWGDWAYAVWPPMVDWERYAPHCTARQQRTEYTDPISLIHNVSGWGYSGLVQPCRRLGVRMHGAPSPDGLIPHANVPAALAAARALVHLKSSDCPGYALYEAIAAGCPCVVPRRLIKRMRMERLFKPGETCLVFDEWGDDWGRGDVDLDACVEEIAYALEQLRNPEVNQRIAAGARQALASLFWTREQGKELRQWIDRRLA